jgi:catechol 2,3-dioxygenase-like lactoylglutathione lyase family enzyme
MPRKRRGARKQRHFYLRLVRWGPDADFELPSPSEVREFVEPLDRVGRLVAHGPVKQPEGDLLVFLAADAAEVGRLLRRDPFARLPGTDYQVLLWSPARTGTGVAIEPPSALGSGRLTHLQRVPVVVSDQTQALAWYRDVLGLTVVTEDHDAQYVELSLGPGAVAISLIAPRPEWGEPSYSEARNRLGAVTGIAFQTDSVEALALRLRHAGARITQEIEEQPWGERTIRFADPDGNEFLAFDRRIARATALA